MPLPLGLMAGGALLGGAGAMFGQSSMNQATQDASNMLSGAWQPKSVQTGAATAGYDPASGQFTTGLTGQTADLQQQLFSQAMADPSGQGADIFGQGQGMLNQAAGMEPIDVQALAGQQSAMLQQMAQPGQDRQMGTGIAQMLASGRLGSTGGQGMLGQLGQQQDAADLGRDEQALGQARDAASLQAQLQNQMFGQGMGMMGFGQDMTQQDFMNRMQSGQAATGLFGLENQAGMLSRGLGQDQFSEAQAQANLAMQGGGSPFGAFLGGLGGGMLNRAMMPRQSQALGAGM